MATDSIAIIKADFALNAQKYGLKDPRIQAELASPGALIGQYAMDPNLPGYGAGDCVQAGGYTPTGTTIVAQSTGALSTATAGYSILGKILPALAPIPIIGQVITGIAAVVMPIIGKIFQHHAQAVAREQGTLCTLIPQVNQVLLETDQAVTDGTLNVQQADAQLEAMVSNFDEAVAQITKDSGSTCNAGCVMKSVVRATADIHEQRYHNSPLYYLKHYWWIGAIAVILVFWKGRD
jgi:hypothetical protein